MRLLVSLLTLLTLIFIAPLRADDKPVSYYKQIRPIFVSNCNACHKPEKLKGELDMTSITALLKGGKHGPGLLAGNPAKSRLIEMITGDDPEMPKDGDPLPPAQVSLITRWIQQ